MEDAARVAVGDARGELPEVAARARLVEAAVGDDAVEELRADRRREPHAEHPADDERHREVAIPVHAEDGE